MTNQDIERATTTTADMVAAGLEQHARAITARVISLLAEDRHHFQTDISAIEAICSAVAIEVHTTRKDAKLTRNELLAGIKGLTVDIGLIHAATAKIESDLNNLNTLHSDQIRDLTEELAALQAELRTYIVGSKRDAVTALQGELILIRKRLAEIEAREGSARLAGDAR